MSLQLIIGESGSGKSYYLYQKIVEESIQYPDKKFLVIVPEQFTMQTQKELVKLHPSHTILNIDILSFQRLAFRILDELGMNDRVILEDTGKNFVIRRLAQEHENDLEFLGDKLKKMGYVSEMKSILSELSQYMVTDAFLESTIEKTSDDPLLQKKLKDILVVKTAFDSYKKEKYITAEEVLQVLSEVALQSDILKDAVIGLDGFTGFTPIQLNLLHRIMGISDRLYVTITMDCREYPFTSLKEEELFALSKKTIWALRKIADESKIKELDPILMHEEGKDRFHACEELRFLEKNILRYNEACYTKKAENIHVYSARDIQEEVSLTAGEILRLINEKGYRYRDIAVITGDMKSYSPYIKRQFQKSHIPTFIDSKRNILSNPFIEYIRAVLNMITEKYTYTAVMRYLRSGLTCLTLEEADLLDNYCIAMGIKGSAAYKKEWIKKYRGQTEEELVRLNSIRERFWQEIESLHELFSNKENSVKAFTEGLYFWGEKQALQKRLKEAEQTFIQNNALDSAKEYSQIYKNIIGLYEKLVELLGGETISPKEYVKLLDAGFEEAKVGIIPPGMDQIVVGDVLRTRLNHIKALFFLGVNDGNIPPKSEKTGLLSELDREMLKNVELELSPDAKDTMYIQQFYLYQILTKPSEKLYVSYSISSPKGDVLRPSYLIGVLDELFPQKQDVSMEAKAKLLSKEQAFVKLAEMISGWELNHDPDYALGKYFLEDPVYHERLSYLLEEMDPDRKGLKLDQAVAKALYGGEIKGTVTRLEKYAACAYAHFLAYGLLLGERKTYSFEAVDYGTVLHEALEEYSRKIKSLGYTWKSVNEKTQIKLIDQCIEEAASNYGNQILSTTARNQYKVERMKVLGRKTVRILTEQLKRSVFEPVGFEVSFKDAVQLSSVGMELKQGGKLFLQGRIDRTDLYETDKAVYVKVMDYKTGKKKFDISEIYEGLSLQLPVYMNAAMEIEQRSNADKEIIPAAMLYYQIKDPILENVAPDNEEQVEEELLKELCTKGLVNSDPNILRMLDEDIQTASNIIPAGITKSGEVSARSNAVQTKQIKQLLTHAQEKMKQFAGEILDGNIGQFPNRQGDNKACDYCAYKSVCGFDITLDSCTYHTQEQLKPEEIWKKLDES